MTHQQQILNLASRMGADPREVELAVALMRTGRIDLIVQVTAQKLTIRGALAKVAQSKPPCSPSRSAAAKSNGSIQKG